MRWIVLPCLQNSAHNGDIGQRGGLATSKGKIAAVNGKTATKMLLSIEKQQLKSGNHVA